MFVWFFSSFVWIFSSIVCTYAYANVYFQNNSYQTNHENNITCGSAYEPGGSGLPYYCTPPVCVPDVLCAIPVWRLSTKKNQKKSESLSSADSSSDPEKVITLTEGITCCMSRLNFGVWKTNLGALDFPGCRNHSRNGYITMKSRDRK